MRYLLSDRGTIEEGVEKYGEIPVGSLIFIRRYDGGEPEKYQNDGEGTSSMCTSRSTNAGIRA